MDNPGTLAIKITKRGHIRQTRYRTKRTLWFLWKHRVDPHDGLQQPVMLSGFLECCSVENSFSLALKQMCKEKFVLLQEMLKLWLNTDKANTYSSVNGRFRVKTTEVRRVHVHSSLLVVTSNQNASNKK